ncbi:MAG: L,D-transpeptidase family protein [Sphingobacteriales bacterium]|nr:L,D-transpeptidase family protein [Sphingobacteriales bacterium]
MYGSLKKIWRLIILFFLAFSNVSGQNKKSSFLFEKFIATENSRINTVLKKPAEVKEFYQFVNFSFHWIPDEKIDNRSYLLALLNKSGYKGLDKNDYQQTFIQDFSNGKLLLKTLDDSMMAELKFTDAAIHFYSDIAYGNVKPPLGYSGLNYSPACKNIPALLAQHLLKGNLPSLLAEVSPALSEIAEIENKILWITTFITNPLFKEVKISTSAKTSSKTQLLLKLYQLGIITTDSLNFADTALVRFIKEAQRQFDLPPDGNLNRATLFNLNIPLWVRLKQLNISINYFRWLSCLQENQDVIVVNIPAAYLKVYHMNRVILPMKIIVGKKSTPTYTLSSRVDEVILYPFWHVPYKIATEELLPRIKHNPSYLDENNYQVLDKSGRIIKPYSINWHALSKTYFPYLIRQSTGCDNSLGLIKLNFYNPFGAYLHDTPSKSLFKYNSRFFSHGCMRMEEPMQLGHLILKNNAIAIDTLEQKGCLNNQSPVIVPADVHMPVIIWYNPAGIDAAGRIVYYQDIYEKFSWMK